MAVGDVAVVEEAGEEEHVGEEDQGEDSSAMRAPVRSLKKRNKM